MSRRHHGGNRPHGRPAGARPGPAPAPAERRTASPADAPAPAPDTLAPEPLVADAADPGEPVEPERVVLAAIPEAAHHAEAQAALRSLESAAVVPPVPAPAPDRRENPVPGGNAGTDGGNGCTAPQLRRFIKSRAYVPMHELRRRFAIETADDDVTPVDLEAGRIFVGLPPREGRLLGELFRAGDIGYELSLDPITPVVVGVYPMRPVARP